MLKISRYIDKKAFKEEFRKLGTNLITASAIGGFVTHAADLNKGTFSLLICLLFIGFSFLFFGIYHPERAGL